MHTFKALWKYEKVRRPLSSVCWASVPGFIYVIGGISDEGTELRSAEVYDPISRRWSALPVMVTRRAYVGVASLNNCIYAVGGWNEALGSLDTVEKYCLEEVRDP